MSGANQHFIPQFLLRSFGRRKNQKIVQVEVWRKDKVFTAPTNSIGAQRYFYSKPDDGLQTLDDEITDYESEVASRQFAALCQPEASNPCAQDAANLVVHLCIRQALIRNAYSSLADVEIAALGEKLSDPQFVWDSLELSRPTPSPAVRDMLEDSLNEHKGKLALSDRNAESLLAPAYSMVQSQFSSLYQPDNPFVAMLTTALRARVADAVTAGHQKALSQSLAPEQRVAALSRLSWKLVDLPGADIILPDSVAISLNEKAIRPLIFAENQGVGKVILPVSPTRILIGNKNLDFRLPIKRLNELLARTTWEFFVSPHRTASHDALRPFIRKEIEHKMNGILRSITRNPLGMKKRKRT